MFEKTPQAQVPLAELMASFPASSDNVAQGSNTIRTVNRYAIVVALLPILVAARAAAQEAPPIAIPFELIQNFINSKKKDIAEHVKLQIIPEAPTAESETEKLDLSGHLLFTDMEEGSRLDLAEADQDEDSEYLNDIFYKAALGQYESLFDLDKQRDLVKLAELNTKWSKGYSEFKEHFDRARPRDAVEDGEFVEDHDLLGGSSYPSGHTWKGYQRSATLMQLFPERADEIFSRAIQYGESRVIVGAHFPMDTIASRIGNLYSQLC